MNDNMYDNRPTSPRPILRDPDLRMNPDPAEPPMGSSYSHEFPDVYCYSNRKSKASIPHDEGIQSKIRTKKVNKLGHSTTSSAGNLLILENKPGYGTKQPGTSLSMAENDAAENRKRPKSATKSGASKSHSDKKKKEKDRKNQTSAGKSSLLENKPGYNTKQPVTNLSMAETRKLHSERKKKEKYRKNQRKFKLEIQRDALEIDTIDRIIDEDLDRNIAAVTTVSPVTNCQRVINLLEQCERESGKKKLVLSNLGLTRNDVPVNYLRGSNLMTDMHELILSGIPLHGVPSDLVTIMNGLSILDLSQCNLKKLPSKWNLPHLQKLNLRHNELVNFPEEAVFKGIPKLEYLDMYGNKVCEIIIPNDTDNLKYLKTLDVGYNYISRIPDELGQVESLRTLNVMNNVIHIIPMKICEMNLNTLDVSSNPLIRPPIETCERGIRSMKRFYDCLSLENRQNIDRQKRELRKIARSGKVRRKSNICQKNSDTAPLSDTMPNDGVSSVTINDTLKVIVVGMARAGKTTIISRLKGATKIPTTNERTVGVHIHKWKPVKDKQEDRRNVNTHINPEPVDGPDSTILKEDSHVKFSVWDFAGQHVYHASHELFFSKRALYILVWDMGVNNQNIAATETTRDEDSDCSSDSSYEFALSDEEDNDADCKSHDIALERDIEDKVQFWVNCIEKRILGAAILIVASHNDRLEENEAKRRCEFMKNYILKKEEQRIEGLQERQHELIENKSADTLAACRIRDQLSERPKILFGDGENDVVRVNGKDNQGINQLAEKIVNIATGREPFGRSPIFQGHIGTRIPRMRFHVRDVVKKMRRDYKVVAGSHLMTKLLERGIDCVADVIDALLFLADIGEISYFGDICNKRRRNDSGIDLFKSKQHDFDTEIESDEENFQSQYIFLNPAWLMSAISCILRHDLSTELEKWIKNDCLSRSEIGAASQGIITATAANLLWRKGGQTKNAEGRILDCAGAKNLKVHLFEFLQELLIQFGVFVPINLNIDIEFSGKGFKLEHHGSKAMDDSAKQRYLLLPSLLGEETLHDNIWNYKKTDTWKDILCNSILFRDGVPPGLMERITASILSDVYETDSKGVDPSSTTRLIINQIHCWRKTLILSSTLITSSCCSKFEIFVHLAEKHEKVCIASRSMEEGMRRLIICGKGPGSFIWEGGYGIVKKAVDHALQGYRGLDFDEQEICPQCLQTRKRRDAGILDRNLITSFTEGDNDTMRCTKGHTIGHRSLSIISNTTFSNLSHRCLDDDSEPDVNANLHKVVLVGVWDKDKHKIVRVGTGFIVDKKKGLIMTAAHNLMNIDGKEDFGKDYFGKSSRRAVIGIIPDKGNVDTKAVFRFFAKIVAKDRRMNGKEECCQVDACVLQITTKMRNDVDGNGDKCDKETEDVILYPNGMNNENLEDLKIVREDCERNQPIHVIGFNQGKELQAINEGINRNFDVTKGKLTEPRLKLDGKMTTHEFRPIAETIVNSCLIEGHSGSPCLNSEGEVIGMVSSSDPHEMGRSYLVPWKELRNLLRRARHNVRP